MQSQFCGLKQHFQETRICLMDDCKLQSRLICKICNQKTHSHKKKSKCQIIDLQLILRDQKALQNESFQYHTIIIKIQDIMKQIKACKNQLDHLNQILNKLFSEYNKYMENQFIIQCHLNSSVNSVNIDQKMLQIIKELHSYNLEEIKIERELLSFSASITNQINDLNQFIKPSYDAQQNQKLQVIFNGSVFPFATISPNNQDILFVLKNKLYRYNIQEASYLQICNFYGQLKSFCISKDYQQFYFGMEQGVLKLQNRYLNKYQQLQLKQREAIDLMVLSKSLAIAFSNNKQSIFLINLKLKKIVLKYKSGKIIDICYIENHNLLIVAKEYQRDYYIDTIQLNSKLKLKRLNFKNNGIINIQMDEQSHQLIIFEKQGILSFIDLNGYYKKSQIKINLQEKEIINTKYSSYLQQIIVFTDQQIIFYNLSGQILKKLRHSYNNLGKIDFYDQRINTSAQDKYIIFKSQGSTSLLRLNQI